MVHQRLQLVCSTTSGAALQETDGAHPTANVFECRVGADFAAFRARRLLQLRGGGPFEPIPPSPQGSP